MLNIWINIPRKISLTICYPIHIVIKIIPDLLDGGISMLIGWRSSKLVPNPWPRYLCCHHTSNKYTTISFLSLSASTQFPRLIFNKKKALLTLFTVILTRRKRGSSHICAIGSSNYEDSYLINQWASKCNCLTAYMCAQYLWSPHSLSPSLKSTIRYYLPPLTQTNLCEMDKLSTLLVISIHIIQETIYVMLQF